MQSCYRDQARIKSALLRTQPTAQEQHESSKAASLSQETRALNQPLGTPKELPTGRPRASFRVTVHGTLYPRELGVVKDGPAARRLRRARLGAPKGELGGVAL